MWAGDEVAAQHSTLQSYAYTYMLLGLGLEGLGPEQANKTGARCSVQAVRGRVTLADMAHTPKTPKLILL